MDEEFAKADTRVAGTRCDTPICDIEAHPETYWIMLTNVTPINRMKIKGKHVTTCSPVYRVTVCCPGCHLRTWPLCWRHAGALQMLRAFSRCRPCLVHLEGRGLLGDSHHFLLGG